MAIEAMTDSPRERPILFSGEMVRAILAGAKTQTRRAIKPQPPHGCEYTINGALDHALCFATGTYRTSNPICVPPTARSRDHRLPCPYGVPGDRLWVRETFALLEDPNSFLTWDGYIPDWKPTPTDTCLHHVPTPIYAADGDRGDVTNQHGHPMRWRPSIHMPRWASRITLEVIGVRVERVQDISIDDAKNEGIAPDCDCRYAEYGACHECMNTGYAEDPRERFRDLWCEINGAESWDANPWVWVLEFRRVQ